MVNEPIRHADQSFAARRRRSHCRCRAERDRHVHGCFILNPDSRKILVIYDSYTIHGHGRGSPRVRSAHSRLVTPHTTHGHTISTYSTDYALRFRSFSISMVLVTASGIRIHDAPGEALGIEIRSINSTEPRVRHVPCPMTRTEVRADAGESRADVSETTAWTTAERRAANLRVTFIPAAHGAARTPQGDAMPCLRNAMTGDHMHMPHAAQRKVARSSVVLATWWSVNPTHESWPPPLHVREPRRKHACVACWSRKPRAPTR